MPIHDWTAVYSGLFHHFHVQWISNLSTALNAGVLPEGYYALAEQHAGPPVPDVLTLHQPGLADIGHENGEGAVAVAVAPPKTKYVIQMDTDADSYARRANRIAVHHPLGDVVAVIEIVSPGNKHSRVAIDQFVKKAVNLLQRGVHLLIVDLFPPTVRDPQGLPPLIWNAFDETPFVLPVEKPLTLAAYVSGAARTAYIEPVAVGEELPSMPIFLSSEYYVRAPLAATYESTWKACPRPLQNAVLNPKRL